MEYAVIDFETASGQLGSLCAVGVVVVRNHRMCEEFYTLINPGCNFSPHCVAIHGITEEMVAHAPDIDQALGMLLPYVKGRVVVAHNASFDVRQLLAAAQKCEIPWEDFDFLCTLTMSRRVFPNQTHYNLRAMAEQIGFSFVHHHALEDARACAKLLIHCLEQTNDQPVSALHIQQGTVRNGVYTGCTLHKPDKQKRLQAGAFAGGARQSVPS